MLMVEVEAQGASDRHCDDVQLACAAKSEQSPYLTNVANSEVGVTSSGETVGLA